MDTWPRDAGYPIRKIDLQRNRITQIVPTTFMGLSQLRILHLAQNRLTEFHLVQLPAGFGRHGVVAPFNVPPKVDLANNLIWVMATFQPWYKSSAVGFDFRGNDLHCNVRQPADLTARSLINCQCTEVTGRGRIDPGYEFSQGVPVVQDRNQDGQRRAAHSSKRRCR